VSTAYPAARTEAATVQQPFQTLLVRVDEYDLATAFNLKVPGD
jgi:hypothetical protein